MIVCVFICLFGSLNILALFFSLDKNVQNNSPISLLRPRSTTILKLIKLLYRLRQTLVICENVYMLGQTENLILSLVNVLN